MAVIHNKACNNCKHYFKGNCWREYMKTKFKEEDLPVVSPGKKACEYWIEIPVEEPKEKCPKCDNGVIYDTKEITGYPNFCITCDGTGTKPTEQEGKCEECGSDIHRVFLEHGSGLYCTNKKCVRYNISKDTINKIRSKPAKPTVSEKCSSEGVDEIIIEAFMILLKSIDINAHKKITEYENTIRYWIKNNKPMKDKLRQSILTEFRERVDKLYSIYRGHERNEVLNEVVKIIGEG